MRVRFGYVAIALGAPEGSPNKTVAAKTLSGMSDPEARLGRVQRLTRENLTTTLRIFRYNNAHQIHVYRLTSKLVPLATHPLTQGWDYLGEFATEWRQIGEYATAHAMRVSAHPDHYTLLNSPRPEVVEAAKKDLEYHAGIFQAMGLSPAPQLVLHIGGVYQGREASRQRFIHEFSRLPDSIRLRLMLENDDKNYSAAETLGICREAGCPMVLDIHHHACRNDGETLDKLWPDIVKTWGNALPKIHVSSPKSEKDFRSHHDYIQLSDILPFLEIARQTGQDFDVMVEAKQKDLALLKLMDDLETAKGIRRIETATIEL